MKKRKGLGRAVPPMAQSEIAALPTGALMARLKRLHWCEDSRSKSDLTDADIAGAAGLILFKDQADWRVAYEDLKAVLATREHLDTGR